MHVQPGETEAAELIVRILAGGPKPKPVVPIELVVRESSGVRH